jgi:hypothetical protein
VGAQTIRAISDRAKRRPCGADASLNRALTILLKSTHFFVLHCDIAMQHLLSYVSFIESLGGGAREEKLTLSIRNGVQHGEMPAFIQRHGIYARNRGSWLLRLALFALLGFPSGRFGYA